MDILPTQRKTWATPRLQPLDLEPGVLRRLFPAADEGIVQGNGQARPRAATAAR